MYVVEKIGTKQGWSQPAPDEDWMHGYPQELAHFYECFAAGSAPQCGAELGFVTPPCCTPPTAPRSRAAPRCQWRNSRPRCEGAARRVSGLRGAMTATEAARGGRRRRGGHLGFILNATYVADPDSGRAVVHLYGRLADGRGFLVRDRRPEPYFYIESSAADQALGLGIHDLDATDRRTLHGAPVHRVRVHRPGDTPAVGPACTGRESPPTRRTCGSPTAT